jgi:hypothetical protein
VLVDGSEIDDSYGAKVGEMGGDRLGPRSVISKWSADVSVTSSKSTSTSGIGGESRAMPKSSILSRMGDREASRGESVIQRMHGGPVLRRSRRRGTPWAHSAGG